MSYSDVRRRPYASRNRHAPHIEDEVEVELVQDAMEAEHEASQGAPPLARRRSSGSASRRGSGGHSNGVGNNTVSVEDAVAEQLRETEDAVAGELREKIGLSPPSLEEEEGLVGGQGQGGAHEWSFVESRTRRGGGSRRRSDSARGFKGGAPGGDDDGRAATSYSGGASAHGNWHYAPLIIALAPPLGAMLGGSADTWTDGILVLLSGFWLYQFLKVPHDLYHVARTRRIVEEDILEEEIEAEEGARSQKGHRVRVYPTEAQKAAMAELRRTELLSLIACVASPIVGAKLLEWLMVNLEDGSRFLNLFNIRLFMLAAGIKPWTHAFMLLRRRLLHLQDKVHYPSLKVERLQRRVARLESDQVSLRKLVALKTDVRLLRDGIDVPLTQLTRTLKRCERKEENLRLSAEDRFSLMEGRFEDLLREVAVNAELISILERQQAMANSLPASIFSAIKFALGQRSAEHEQMRRFLQNTQRGLPSAASLIGNGQVGSPIEPGPQQVLSPPVMSPTGSGGSPPKGFLSPQGSLSSPTSERPRSLSYTNTPQSTTPGRSNSGGYGEPRSASSSWTGRGLTSWALLPLSLPSAALQVAKNTVVGAAAGHDGHASGNKYGGGGGDAPRSPQGHGSAGGVYAPPQQQHQHPQAQASWQAPAYANSTASAAGRPGYPSPNGVANAESAAAPPPHLQRRKSSKSGGGGGGVSARRLGLA